MTRKVTIQDISRHSGTSPSTVSRVLTGNAAVSLEKREAVENAIQALNYRPSQLARSLKTRVTYTIGLLLNDITNPFYSAITRGAEDEAHRQGYSLMLCNSNENPTREHQYLQVLQDKHVDGIILGPTGSNEDFLLELAKRMCLIQIDRRLTRLDAPSVTVDNAQAAYSATQLLIERGHTHIGMITWQRDLTSLQERIDGYRRALAEHQLAFDPEDLLAVEAITLHEVTPPIQAFLAQQSHLTAIIALNNQLGMGLIAALQNAQRRIPQDVAVIVFDDLEMFGLMQPSITSIAQPAYVIGQQAIKLLLRHIQNRDDTANEHLVLPTRLIVRQSI